MHISLNPYSNSKYYALLSPIYREGNRFRRLNSLSGVTQLESDRARIWSKVGLTLEPQGILPYIIKRCCSHPPHLSPLLLQSHLPAYSTRHLSGHLHKWQSCPWDFDWADTWLVSLSNQSLGWALCRLWKSHPSSAPSYRKWGVRETSGQAGYCHKGQVNISHLPVTLEKQSIQSRGTHSKPAGSSGVTESQFSFYRRGSWGHRVKVPPNLQVTQQVSNRIILELEGLRHHPVQLPSP